MAGESEACNLVVVGHQSTDIALVVNGLIGIQLLTAEETNQRMCVIKEHTAQAPGVTDGPNQPCVKVKVCVFAGLGADSQQTPELIRQSCPKDTVGVLIYTVTANGLGIETTEMIEEINKVTRAYGADIWQNSVIVFLNGHQCANALQDVPNQQAAVSQRSFNRAVDVWTERVQNIMLSRAMITSMPQKVVQTIGFAVAGKENELQLPGRDFWLSVMWVKVFEKSKNAFYKKGVSKLANFQSRMKERSEMRRPEVSDDTKSKQIWEQPISTGYMSYSQKVFIAAGGTAAGVAAGGIGATIGALIGALAIGIPSFGIAAGAGLVIGAAVGSGIGVGVAGATTVGVNAYKSARERKEQEECKLL